MVKSKDEVSENRWGDPAALIYSEVYMTAGEYMLAICPDIAGSLTYFLDMLQIDPVNMRIA